MKKEISSLLVMGVASTVFGATLYVDLESANPAAPYSTWETAATSIQDAVDAAASNDVVLVTDGHYVLSSEIAVAGDMVISSVNGPAVTIVDGNASNRCFNLSGASMVSGLMITNGYTSENGGGIYASSTNSVITNCVVSGCLADGSGGGICGGTVTHCTVSLNDASGSGGGACDSVVLDSIITDNVASEYGGGMQGGTAKHSTIENNMCFKYYGGGASEGKLYYCTIRDNMSFSHGGGLYRVYAYSCIIEGNIASLCGGGSYCSWELFYCVIANNLAGMNGGGASGYQSAESGGFFHVGLISSWPAINCTFMNNLAPNAEEYVYNGISYYHCSEVSGIPVYNSIIYNTLDGAPKLVDASSYVAFSCTSELLPLINGNITNAPSFMDASSGNFKLRSDSVCIDAGFDLKGRYSVTQLATGSSIEKTYEEWPYDINGNPRVAGRNPDMGAYEYQGVLPDSDGDSLSDNYETLKGLNALLADTDGDGFDDGFEVDYGLDPLVSDAVILSYITNHSSAFEIGTGGGYSLAEIADLRYGSTLVAVSNNTASVRFYVDVSTNLGNGWITAPAVEYNIDVSGEDVGFFRVRGEDETTTNEVPGYYMILPTVPFGDHEATPE